MEGRGRLAPRPRVWLVELDPRRDMKGATENDGFARREDCDLIEQPASLHRNDAAEVVDVVRILKTVADEVGALADDGLADFAGTLAGDHERNAELPTLLGNTFKGQASEFLTSVFVRSRRPGVVMRFL